MLILLVYYFYLRDRDNLSTRDKTISPKVSLVQRSQKSMIEFWYPVPPFQGGVVGIEIVWDCDLDRKLERCDPEYNFRRYIVDPLIMDPLR